MPVQFYEDVVRTEIGVNNKKLPSDVQLAITQYIYPELKGVRLIVSAPHAMVALRGMKMLFVLRHVCGDTSENFE
jgi:hypothetical protein